MHPSIEYYRINYEDQSYTQLLIQKNVVTFFSTVCGCSITQPEIYGIRIIAIINPTLEDITYLTIVCKEAIKIRYTNPYLHRLALCLYNGLSIPIRKRNNVIVVDDVLLSHLYLVYTNT